MPTISMFYGILIRAISHSTPKRQVRFILPSLNVFSAHFGGLFKVVL